MSNKSIQITEFDLQRLNRLLRKAQHTDYRGSEYLAELQAELDRAQIVPSQAVSQEVVTMNSIVVLLDPRNKERRNLHFGLSRRCRYWARQNLHLGPYRYRHVRL